MMSCAWIWIYIGLALVLLELAAPGFILCFFGLAALLVGVLRFVFGETMGLTAQLAAFSVLSILSIVLLRRTLKKIFVGDRTKETANLSSDYVGRLGSVVEAIGAGEPGRILIGDAEWTATADQSIGKGVRVRVISQNNLTMKVEVLSND